MVGDRYEDIMAGYENKQKTIFASYGYGKAQEGEKATYKINSIEELMDIL